MCTWHTTWPSTVQSSSQFTLSASAPTAGPATPAPLTLTAPHLPTSLGFLKAAAPGQSSTNARGVDRAPASDTYLRTFFKPTRHGKATHWPSLTYSVAGICIPQHSSQKPICNLWSIFIKWSLAWASKFVNPWRCGYSLQYSKCTARI